VSSPKGFVLQSSFGEVPKSHRFCSPKERQPSSGSNKAPLGMDLDPVFVMDPVLDLGLYPDPVLDLGLVPVLAASPTSLVATVSPVIRAPACPAADFGAPVMSVAPVLRVKQFSFPPVLEDAPLNSAHAKVPYVSKSSLGLRREAI
jgi:hypothetical protein